MDELVILAQFECEWSKKKEAWIDFVKSGNEGWIYSP
jgi:hypothetical protein